MTILVDIDGVIFNTQEHLLELLNTFNHTNFTIENIDSYDWFDKNFTRPFDLTENIAFWNDIKTNEEAIKYILKWKREGHAINFVTASHYHYGLPTKIHRLLDCFNGEFDDKDVIICHDKSMVRGDILIDDFTDNVNKFTTMDYDQYAILFSQSWNDVKSIKDNANIIRSNNWKEIDTTIKYIESKK